MSKRISELPAASTPLVGTELVEIVQSGVNCKVARSDLAPAHDLLSALVSAEVAITGAVTLTNSAFGKMHVCSGTTADYTVGLPAVSGNTGKFIGFRMAPGLTKLVTLDANGTELINGRQTRVMWANEVAILLCDGSTWVKIGGMSLPMSCGMYPTAATSVAIQPTRNLVPISAVIVDNTGAMASASNNRIICRRTGLYRISANCYYQAGAGSSKELRCIIDKNGVQNGVGFSIEWRTVLAAEAIRIEFFTDAELTAGDYLQLLAMVNTSVRDLYVNDPYWTFMKVTEVPQW